MRNEAAFSKSLRTALELSGAMVQSVESGSTALGIPDIYFRTLKIDGWIELKNLVYPIRGHLDVPFRPGQYAWLKRHWEMGGTSVLAISGVEGIWFYKGDRIQKTYTVPFTPDLSLNRLDGKRIVEWLEEEET